MGLQSILANIDALNAEGEPTRTTAQDPLGLGSQAAKERLARERYGDPFVDRNGDVMGFRERTTGDFVREFLGGFATRDLQFSERRLAAGAQLRAELEDELLERTEARRKDFFDLFRGIKTMREAGLKPKAIAGLIGEQWQGITGQAPHPGVLQALIDSDAAGGTTLDDILGGIGDGSLSLEELEGFGVSIPQALDVFTKFQGQRRQGEADARAVRAEKDKEARLALARRKEKRAAREGRDRRVDRIARTMLESGQEQDMAAALARAQALATGRTDEPASTTTTTTTPTTSTTLGLPSQRPVGLGGGGASLDLGGGVTARRVR
jgi:hypothetical protein